MRIFRAGVMGLAALLGAAQLVRPERINPPADRWPALVEETGMPPDVSAALWRACADCHSNRTRWPWYSALAPGSWFVADHVNHGRRHLNLSEWPPTDAQRARDVPHDLCREARDGRMPLRSYLLLHPDARLTATEVDALCRWADRPRPARAFPSRTGASR